jgi:hypothetical protein
MKAVEKAIDGSGEIPPASNHIPSQTLCVSRDKLARYLKMKGLEEGKTDDSKKRSRNRRISELDGLGYLGVWGDWIWVINRDKSH